MVKLCYTSRDYKLLLYCIYPGYRQTVKDIVQGALFPEAGLENAVGHAGGSGGLVVVRDLNLFSFCESCLLPFEVNCHVGYVPSGQRVVGLSKLSRVAEVFAKRLQEPERLAYEICSALHQAIKPAGVAVMLQCSHIHFPNLESVFLDSNHQAWMKLQVCSGSGVFEAENADIWSDFMSLLKFRGINVNTTSKRNLNDESWCPSRTYVAKSSSTLDLVNHGMVAAVASIIRLLGEDPSRKELVGTPTCYVKWLMNFQNSNLEMKLHSFPRSRLDPLNPNREVSHKEKQMQAELNISFWSQCEHHLLPFHGVVHIGYICSEGLCSIGKSLLQSIVHFYGFKLQVQERLTKQIAETVSSLLGGDVIVVVEASHTCMISRGIEKFGSSTATIAALGRYSTDSASRAAFLQSIPKATIIEG